MVTEGAFDPHAATLAGALDIDPADDVADLPRYDIGCEAPPPKRSRRERSAPSPYRGQAQTDELLADYTDDAKAGVGDEAIAKKTGLSSHQVARWRRRHGVHRKAGRPTSWKRASVMAIDIFGRTTTPTVMSIASPVDGHWSPPEYLLRYPLRYENFAELVMTLVEVGHGPTMIASGLRLRDRDVVDACRLWAARRRL